MPVWAAPDQSTQQRRRSCGTWRPRWDRTVSEEKLTEVGDANAPEPQAVVEVISGMAALRRAPRLADVAEVAAFLASDRAAGMTGTMVNATCGLVLR